MNSFDFTDCLNAILLRFILMFSVNYTCHCAVLVILVLVDASRMVTSI